MVRLIGPSPTLRAARAETEAAVTEAEIKAARARLSMAEAVAQAFI